MALDDVVVLGSMNTVVNYFRKREMVDQKRVSIFVTPDDANAQIL